MCMFHIRDEEIMIVDLDLFALRKWRKLELQLEALMVSRLKGRSLRFLLLNLTRKACLGLVLFCRRGENESEAVVIAKKSVKAFNIGRSFKEMVEGSSQHLKVDH